MLDFSSCLILFVADLVVVVDFFGAILSVGCSGSIFFLMDLSVSVL